MSADAGPKCAGRHLYDHFRPDRHIFGLRRHLSDDFRQASALIILKTTPAHFGPAMALFLTFLPVPVLFYDSSGKGTAKILAVPVPFTPSLRRIKNS